MIKPLSILRRFRLELDLLPNDLPELFRRLHGLKATVKVDRRLNILVPEQAPHGFVVTGMMLEIEGCRGMSELVDSDPQPGGLLDPLGDLCTKHVRRLGLPAFPWEQPRSI